MKQTISAVAATSPAQHAAPNPRRGSRTTTAPCSSARRSEPSLDPLSTTMARYPVGRRESTHGNASASLSTGSTTSGIAPTVATTTNANAYRTLTIRGTLPLSVVFTSDRFPTIDPMRVLVTGGAGFIGSHVVDALVVGGHDVVVLDSLDPAAHGPERPDYLNPDARYVWGDVCSVDDWRTCLTGVEAVSHQAGRVGLGSSAADVRAYVAANDEGTAAGLWAMHDTSFHGRLVLASSMVVYGEGAYRCAAHGGVRPSPRTIEDLRAGRFEPLCPVCGGALTPEAVPEDAPLEPRSVYAATKLHQEQLCAAVGREAGWPVTALRYHNVYGPRMPRDTPYAGVASIFRSALAAGEAPAVYEDGAQRRDFVHVSDVAHANVRALTAGRAILRRAQHRIGRTAQRRGPRMGTPPVGWRGSVAGGNREMAAGRCAPRVRVACEGRDRAGLSGSRAVRGGNH